MRGEVIFQLNTWAKLDKYSNFLKGLINNHSPHFHRIHQMKESKEEKIIVTEL
jgi:hypothetical protein